jgi:hypothetical protein
VLRNYFGQYSLFDAYFELTVCAVGSRWLNRREAEVDLVTNMLYFSLTSMRGERNYP